MKTSRARRHPLFYQVARELKSHDLLAPARRLLVAVSGGPDSVGLLAVMDELRKIERFSDLTLHIAHMNYGLRGRESDEDEQFVRQLAADRAIPVSCERVELVHTPGESLQATARELRYAFFGRLCETHRLSGVATGHTADDQAETVLMWLLRGSGLKGLAGIPILRQGRILRPLLHVRRGAILEYLASQGLSYRSDSSNSADMYRRNQIRQKLLPQLRAMNPAIVDTLARTAEILSDDAAVLEEVEHERWAAVLRETHPDRVSLDVPALRACAPGLRRRLIRRAWAQLNGTGRTLNFRQAAALADTLLGNKDSGHLDLSLATRVRRRGAVLIFERSQTDVRVRTSWWSGVPLSVPGQVILSRERRISAVPVSEQGATDRTGERNHRVCVIDMNRAGSPLIVRSWQPGDWFCPTGMGGRRKKLQDFFVDQKIPREDRSEVPLVAGPTGIVWVAGCRGDERVRPQQGSARLVTLTLEEGAHA